MLLTENLNLINTYLNLGGVAFSLFLVGLIFKIKYDNSERQKHLIHRLDHLIEEIKIAKRNLRRKYMLYKGRPVSYVRDAGKNDPYFDSDYPQVIVEYVDGEGRETVKEVDLVGWDAEKREGKLTDQEKEQARVLEQARNDASKINPNAVPADQQPDMKVQIVDPRQAQENAKRAEDKAQKANRK